MRLMKQLIGLMVLTLSTFAFAGDVIGTIKFDGTAPKLRKIDMAKEPVCEKEHDPPIAIQAVVPGPNNTLTNVLVYISKGLPTGKSYPTPTETVNFEQRGCMYYPHVVATMVNQPLKVTNSDAVVHNVHPLAKENREWNRSQTPGSPPIETKFEKPEITMAVKCNLHPWMRAYIAVFNHPYFAVSDQNGKFTIKGLPPGHYTITAWQESWGEQTIEVDVTPTGSKAVTLTYKAKPVY